MDSVKQQECSVAQLGEALASGTPPTLVDVREYPEYAAGRIRGSRLIPLGDLERRASELDRGAPVYLVCRTGRRSALAGETLRRLGFREVWNVRGGMTEWQGAGYPVERDARAPWSLERQVRLVAGLLVLAGALLSLTMDPRFAWLSAFVGAGLAFAAVTEWCGMALLLARLPWNRAPGPSCPGGR